MAPADAVHCTDVGPPMLIVKSPTEGMMFTNQGVPVDLEASDECGVRSVVVSGSGADDGTFWVPPYMACINPPNGEIALKFTAEDNAGKQTSATVHVTVNTNPDAGIPPCASPPSPVLSCSCALAMKPIDFPRSCWRWSLSWPWPACEATATRAHASLAGRGLPVAPGPRWSTSSCASTRARSGSW